MPYQTFNKTSINQWKTKYHTKNNSSKIQYTNPDTTKNMSIPSPHIRQYSKEYTIINSKQKSSIINNKSFNKKKINIMSNFQIYLNKNSEKINNKNKNVKKIIENDDNLYHKLDNIKLRCHHLLKNFYIHSNYLKNEIDKYKNNNNISLKHNKFYNERKTEI